VAVSGSSAVFSGMRKSVSTLFLIFWGADGAGVSSENPCSGRGVACDSKLFAADTAAFYREKLRKLARYLASFRHDSLANDHYSLTGAGAESAAASASE
jgi:hypothetical protein